MVDGARGAHFVQSLERGLAVISCFDAGRPEMTLTEVAAATGLDRAAARRFLLTLVDLNYARFDGKRFRLGPRVLELGYAYLSGFSLPQVAEPHLAELVAEVGEFASVSILDGVEIVDVAARVPTSQIMRVSSQVGARFPAFATSMGRVLLAGLEPGDLECRLQDITIEQVTEHTIKTVEELRDEVARVREAGYSIVDQELEYGLMSIAVPVREPSGRVIAGINVAGQSGRVTPDRARRDFLPRLLRTSAAITTDLIQLKG
jgi:IclR family pca regulon transcriptional regulator